MPAGSRERGFTYLALLVAVAVAGVGLAAAGQSASTAEQRSREAQLLYAGAAYRAAIMSYYESSPGAAKVYPQSLEDLLEDRRVPFVRRHLRRLYRDPMTASGKWGLVRAPEGGGIMGVHSLSSARPFKTAGFGAAARRLEGKARYSEWRFVYEPGAP